MATLTVTMCNYNHGACIGRAIEAIASQSRPPDQFVIVDDGSTDNSPAIIRSYAERYSFIQCEMLPKNTRIVGALKRVMELATGDYLYSASSDDYILPGFFEKSMSLLAAHPDAGLCFSDPYIEQGDTGARVLHAQALSSRDCFLPSEDLVAVMKKRRVWVAGNTCLVRAAALAQAGGYDFALRWHCDWFVMLVIAFRYGACYVPEGFAVNVVMENQWSSGARKDAIQQNSVLCHMLDRMLSLECSDVLPKFQRAGCLADFWHPWYAPELLRAIRSSSRFWTRDTLKLIRIPFLRGIKDGLHYSSRIPARTGSMFKRAIWRPVPEGIKQFYRAHRDKRNSGQIN